MMTPPGPGIWVLRDPQAATNAIRVHVVGASFSIDEDATAFHPLRSTVSQRFGQRPVVQSDYIGGADGTCEMWTDSEAEWYLLKQLLQTPRTLWLIRPDFGALWVRFMARSWPEETPRTGFGEDSVWRRKITVAYLEVDRPT